MCGTEPIRYVTLHFEIGAAQFRFGTGVFVPAQKLPGTACPGAKRASHTNADC